MKHGSLLRGILASILIGLVSPAAAQTPGTCVVTRVEGQAFVSARGAGVRSAVTGLGLGRNAKLRTDAGGRITMTCSGGLDVVVGPESEVDVIGLLDGGARPFGLRLIDGIAGFLFSSDEENGVQVRTPSAVAAVRSTQWAMRVENRASAIFARTGMVFVVTDDDDARLGPGDGVDVTPSGEIGPVTPWGQARIDRFGALLGPDW
ncbi:FecR protein [Salinihabitans flavidus]|uniref:FecR protein n=1 Tax=Salinihabitans flavidus TaxID=569882 RepID=A0A1H8UAV3_9RHOB|nr:FecR domain-containing protein [Salinihabitans flavidus]SEP00167.1 FecR protein [Salinihabitans flavidus]